MERVTRARVVGGLIAVLCLAAGGVRAQVGLPRHVVDLTGLARGLVLGDLDGDAFPDLVASDFGATWVLLNDGRGGFGLDVPGSSLLTDVAPLDDLDLADLDGNGALDILGVKLFDGTLRVYPGIGDGGFLSVVTHQAISLPVDLETGDLDGDGDPDVMVLGQGAERARPLLNDGLGGLTPAADVPTGDTPSSLALGDLDGDGSLDLVVTDLVDDVLHVALGTGDGTFEAPSIYAAGPEPDRVSLGDATGDGVLDVVFGSNAQAVTSVGMRVGVGDGSLGPQLALDLGWPQIRDPLLVDLDEDGLLDLVGIAAVDDRVLVSRGLGGVAFTLPEAWPAPGLPWRLRAADVDQDGDLDLVPLGLANGRLSILPGRGDGRFAREQPLASEPSELAVGDFDEDGRPDLLVTATASVGGEGVVQLLLGGPRGAYQPATLHPAGPPTTEVVAADFTEDGHLDAALLHDTTRVTVLPGRGDGTFGTTLFQDLLLVDSYDLQSADLDEDGHQDLALLGGSSGWPRWYAGAGDGSFGPTQSVGNHSAGGLTLADTDGDGHLDVVTHRSAEVASHLGAGDGTFGALGSELLSPTGLTGMGPMTIGDFDEDGVVDVALLVPDGPLTVLIGRGDGLFGVPQPAGAVQLHPLAVRAADLDDDGHPDLVAGGSDDFVDGALSVHRGHGDGTFDPPVALPLVARPVRGELADLDGDGVADLAWAVGQDPTFGNPTTTAAEHVTVLLSTAGPWSNLGFPLAGSDGVPTLWGEGPLTAGSSVRLSAEGGLASATIWIVAGTSTLVQPFKGGVLVPSPELLIPLPLDGDGAFSAETVWPPGVPAGAILAWQGWIDDPAGPKGWSTTNGVVSTAP
jgi:hypothetical protein